MAAAQGNQYAAKAKQWSMAIERAITAYPDLPDDADCSPYIKGLNKAACLFVSKMMDEGSVIFFREFGDRLEGKPAQSLELSGDPDNPIAITEIVRTIVKPK